MWLEFEDTKYARSDYSLFESMIQSAPCYDLQFDILSDDVFIANDMESSGEPSAVHISEYTRMALEANNDADQFVLKEFKPDEEKSSKLSRKQR